MKTAILLLLWVISNMAMAQQTQEKNSYFDANCLNILSGENNSLLEINFNPQLFHIELGSGNAVANLEIQVSVRPKEQRNFLIRKQFLERIEHRFLADENVFFRRYGFSLPTGVYAVEIEVTDRHDGRLYFASLNYESKNLREGYQLSDIVLEQDFLGALGAQKLLTGKISPHPGNLRYWLEVYAPTPAPLTCRAVLYRKSDQSSDQVSRFSAMNQQVAVLKPAGGKVRFADTLGLESIESGEYLLEIYLELDRKLVAEESRAFTVEWKKAGRIFGNLDHSIEMMEYIATPNQIKELLALPTEEEKIDRFQQFWEKMALRPGATGTPTMESYFERVFYAQDNLAEEGLEGYQTERGKYHILLGAPIRSQTLNKGEEKWQIWDYDQPKMRVVFKWDGSQWVYQKP